MTRARIRGSSAAAAPVDLGDGVTVAVLTDAVADHRRAIEDCFPGDPGEGWDEIKRRFPETLSFDGRWRLPMNCFAVRTREMVILVDTGVGCPRTLASEMFQTTGCLPDLLAQHGLVPDALDAIFFTHLHEDHLGWADDPDTGEPTFPSARYLVSREEWEANHSDQGAPDWVQQALDPVHARGRVDLVDPGECYPGLEVVSLPGHTPGHCGLVITGPSARVVLLGDAFNHPQQVAEPDLPSLADADRAQAIATRRTILARARASEWLILGSAHFPGGWWTIDAD